MKIIQKLSAVQCFFNVDDKLFWRGSATDMISRHDLYPRPRLVVKRTYWKVEPIISQVNSEKFIEINKWNSLHFLFQLVVRPPNWKQEKSVSWVLSTKAVERELINGVATSRKLINHQPKKKKVFSPILSFQLRCVIRLFDMKLIEEIEHFELWSIK